MSTPSLFGSRQRPDARPLSGLAAHAPAAAARQQPAPAEASAPGALQAGGATATVPLPRQRPRREDQAFLPAALELIETPPSPVHLAFILIMAAFVAAAAAWMWLGQLDIVAVAQGKIQPSGQVKMIQSAETAKVLRIAEQNGAEVRAGDVLVVFDESEARADVEALTGLRLALKAEIARRSGALARLGGEAGAALQDAAAPPVAWPADVPPPVRDREAAVLAGDLAQLATVLEGLEAQVRLKQSERDRLAETLAAQKALVATLRARVSMRSSLAATGAGSRASVIDAEEALRKEETVLSTQRGEWRDSTFELEVLAAERDLQVQNFVTEYTRKRADAARALDETEERLAKARARLGNMTLRSPVDGVVEASALVTPGQVVFVGQEIMRIVPAGARLEVVAYLANRDAGFVHEGEPVTVKVDSFPFSRFGTLSGTVAHVARDAIPLADVGQIESGPGRIGESLGFAGAQRTQNLVFPVIITLDPPDAAGPATFTVSPGMTVTVEVLTGRRSVFAYVFAPLVETADEALHER